MYSSGPEKQTASKICPNPSRKYEYIYLSSQLCYKNKRKIWAVELQLIVSIKDSSHPLTILPYSYTQSQKSWRCVVRYGIGQMADTNVGKSESRWVG